MTREEAIQVLEEEAEYLYQDDRPYNREAFDMAIEALSKPNYETDTEVRLAVTNRKKEKVVLWDAFGEVQYYPIEALQPDAVSREDYEDIIKDYRKQYENMNNEIADLEAKLADAVPFDIQLQSTREVLDQFAEDSVKVVRCKDCRWFKQDSSPVGYGYCDGRMVGREVDYNDYCSHGERQCNYFGERREE